MKVDLKLSTDQEKMLRDISATQFRTLTATVTLWVIEKIQEEIRSRAVEENVRTQIREFHAPVTGSGANAPAPGAPTPVPYVPDWYVVRGG